MTVAGHVRRPMYRARRGWSMPPINQLASRKDDTVFTATFFIALALSTVVALPGDWARRHSSREVANALNLANAVALVAIVGFAASLGLAHGLGEILGLLSGIGTGQQLADAAASSRWGQVPVSK